MHGPKFGYYFGSKSLLYATNSVGEMPPGTLELVDPTRQDELARLLGAPFNPRASCQRL